jgi:tRNA (guanine37-N1)-methyltransferase
LHLEFCHLPFEILVAMRIDVLTLFPEMFFPVLGASILKRAADAELVEYHATDIRNYTADKHGKVDDRPFGGGPGMVMACQPLWDAVAAVEKLDPRPATRIMMCPTGLPLTQPIAEELAKKDRLLIIAGHYEGIDQRVIDRLDPRPISIGDYVLSGGELPAMVLIDAVVRLIPGALGDEQSAVHDSFSPGSDRKLDHPHYTRPRVWQGAEVPDILLSGDHAEIELWRKQQADKLTRRRRPDLLDDND